MLTGTAGPMWASTADPSTWTAPALATIGAEAVPVVRWNAAANGGSGAWLIVSQSGIVERQLATPTPNTFSSLASGLPTYVRSMDCASNGTLVVAVGGNVLASWSRVSNDGGATWADSGAPTPGQVARSVRAGFDSPLAGAGELFAVVGDGGTVASQSMPIATGDGWVKATKGSAPLHALFGSPGA
jgi:hypothetical protein